MEILKNKGFREETGTIPVRTKGGRDEGEKVRYWIA